MRGYIDSHIQFCTGKNGLWEMGVTYKIKNRKCRVRTHFFHLGSNTPEYILREVLLNQFECMCEGLIEKESQITKWLFFSFGTNEIK